MAKERKIIPKFEKEQSVIFEKEQSVIPYKIGKDFLKKAHMQDCGFREFQTISSSIPRYSVGFKIQLKPFEYLNQFFEEESKEDFANIEFEVLCPNHNYETPELNIPLTQLFLFEQFEYLNLNVSYRRQISLKEENIGKPMSLLKRIDAISKSNANIFKPLFFSPDFNYIKNNKRSSLGDINLYFCSCCDRRKQSPTSGDTLGINLNQKEAIDNLAKDVGKIEKIISEYRIKASRGHLRNKIKRLGELYKTF